MKPLEIPKTFSECQQGQNYFEDIGFLHCGYICSDNADPMMGKTSTSLPRIKAVAPTIYTSGHSKKNAVSLNTFVEAVKYIDFIRSSFSDTRF